MRASRENNRKSKPWFSKTIARIWGSKIARGKSRYSATSLIFAFDSNWMENLELTTFSQERKRMSMKFPNRVCLPEDEQEVRRLVELYQSMQSGQQQQQLLTRRCLSASNVIGASNSNTFNGESDSYGLHTHAIPHSKQQPTGTLHVHFGPLAAGRSPIMKRRALPSPVPTNRDPNAIWPKGSD